VRHRQQQRRIRSGTDPDPLIGTLGGCRAHGINHDYAATPRAQRAY
jgi:hypothetical protein